MTTKQKQAVQMLDVPPADFFSFNEATQLRLQEALSTLVGGGEPPGQAEAAPQPIVALGAPKRVDIDKQDVVPLLLGRVQTGLRSWQVNDRTNLHLFVRELATGELWIVQPLTDLRRGKLELRSGAGKPPDDLNARTLQSSVTFIDLRKRLDGRMKAGRFLVTAAAYDVLSNSVEIHVESSAEPVKAAIMATPQPYVTPVLDKRAHLETRVEVPKEVSKDGRGSIDVAIQVSEDSGVRKAESGDAFWTCHLILVKLDARPDVVPASVPVQAISTVDGKSAFNAVFRLDLAAIAKTTEAGQYQVYLDAGGGVLGPYPLAIGAP